MIQRKLLSTHIMNHRNLAQVSLVLIFLVSLTTFSCGGRPEVSSAKISGKFEFFDPKSKQNQIETIVDVTKFERIVAIALGQGPKGSNLELPIQFVVDLKGRRLLLSVNLKQRIGDDLQGKHQLVKQLTATNFSFVLDGVTYLAESGHCVIEKIRFGKKGYVKGKFMAEFPYGGFSGEFNVIIDETLSSYQG